MATLKLNGDEVQQILLALRRHKERIEDIMAENPNMSMERTENVTRAMRLTVSAKDKITALLGIEISREE